MKNYRLAIALLALLTIASFTFPVTGSSVQNSLPEKSSPKVWIPIWLLKQMGQKNCPFKALLK